jgi:hypothetical protein
MVQERLKIAQSRQKSYAEKRRRDLSFEISDFVYLKVSPMRGTRRFKIKGKLAPRYVRPFMIIDHKGEVAYQLELPPQLSDVYDGRRDLSFEISDFVYLKVSPMRGTRRFKIKGKLAPRYVGPFMIIDHKGEVAYQLELPPQLSDVYDVFHVS